MAQDRRAQDVGRKSDGRRTEVERMSDKSWKQVQRTSDGNRTKVEQTLDGRRTEVGSKFDERQTKVRRMSDKQSSATTATMASGGVALQLLATECYNEAGRTFQLAVMARLAKRCSSLLWRGWQWVTTRCCGNGQQRCNSRRWPTARCSPGQRFCFFLLDSFKERTRTRQREKRQSFKTCFNFVSSSAFLWS